LGGESATIAAAWQDFLDSCAAALGFDGASADSTAAEALAAQTAALAAGAEVATMVLTDAAAVSAALVAPTAAAVVTAQAALDAEDAILGNILVPGMEDLFDAVFGGFINPGELSISRVISDDDPTDAATDIAKFSGNVGDYTIVEGLPGGFTEITDNRPLPLNLPPGTPGNDGRDLVRNVERLVFSDTIVTLPLGSIGGNSPAMGTPTISGTPDVDLTLTASIAGVTDADNVSSGGVVDQGAVSWTWESELEPGSDFFTPITRLGGINGTGDPVAVTGESLVLTALEEGLRVRVVGTFQDEDLVFEVVTSAPVQVSGVPGAGLPPGISIRFATWNPAQDRLRVAGDVTPINSTVTLFVPGTTTDGIACTLGIDGAEFVLPVDVDSEFLFDSLGGVDPVDVCVQSDDGLGAGPVRAVSAGTT